MPSTDLEGVTTPELLLLSLKMFELNILFMC